MTALGARIAALHKLGRGYEVTLGTADGEVLWKGQMAFLTLALTALPDDATLQELRETLQVRRRKGKKRK